MQESQHKSKVITGAMLQSQVNVKLIEVPCYKVNVLPYNYKSALIKSQISAMLLEVPCYWRSHATKLG